MVQQPVVGQSLIIIEASRSHSDTPHSVGVLRTSDQLRRRDLYLTRHDTHHRQTSIHNSSKGAAANPRLKERDNWDWQKTEISINSAILLGYRLPVHEFSRVYIYRRTNSPVQDRKGPTTKRFTCVL